MKNLFKLQTLALALALASAFGAAMLLPMAQAAPMFKAESAYAVAKERCDDQAGNAKDVCRKEAKAIEVKALADAKLGRQVGEARSDASQSKRDADYKVAAERCEALSGDAKSQCMSSAKSNFGKS